MSADLILFNGQFHTVDRENPRASAVAISEGRFVAVGTDAQAMVLRGSGTQVIDLKGRCVIPGLNDSHLHLIRGGLNYNLELRWEGVPSLADALRLLKEQADRTPTPQWVRVVGGWNEFQFAEKRMPTLEELNQAAPDTPVFVLHLYDRALLNRAALRVAGYTRDTPNPPGGEIVRDGNGNRQQQVFIGIITKHAFIDITDFMPGKENYDARLVHHRCTCERRLAIQQTHIGQQF